MKLPYILFLVSVSWTVLGQNDSIVRLLNPSFEDYPRLGSCAEGWDNCGFDRESPPDIHPVLDSPFRVSISPSDGKTYVGMVTRDNTSWEAFGQTLETPLKANQAYGFSIDLCRSSTYASMGRSKETFGNSILYDKPVKLLIWGGFRIGDRQELLAESAPVENTNWQRYDFVLEAKSAYSYLIFEAFYASPPPPSYAGNLLLDHASNLVPIDKNVTDWTKTIAFQDWYEITVPYLGNRRSSVENYGASLAELELQDSRRAFFQEFLRVKTKELRFEEDKTKLSAEGIEVIASIINHFPEMPYGYKILIALHHEDADLNKARAAILKEAFVGLGIDNIIKVKVQKPKFNTKKWTAYNDDLRVKLIKK